ncbi:MAG: hypothetical protein NWF06_08905 [Candidatus Bathyarchaeota archaeon]|nr:hypothetical protein [Candidatus Bathyarchaeum sp.]
MSWEKELSQRLLRVIPLSEKRMKYVQKADAPEEELLTRKVLLSLAKMVYEKREPVKLREIVDDLYSSANKREMDVVRLLIKKTLIPSGIVEKLYVGKKDVRYLLAAYRFQETRKLHSSSGQVISEPVGPIVEIPREYFPIPSEVLELLLQKTSLESVLTKIDKDFSLEKISESLYQSLSKEYNASMADVCERLKDYDELVKLLDLNH